MNDEERRRFFFAGYLVAGVLAAAATGLIAPPGGSPRSALLLHCLAVGLFGTLVWISVRTRNLFPALLLVIVIPVSSELLRTPVFRNAALAAAVNIVLPVSAFLGAGLLCRPAGRGFVCRLVALAGFVSLASAAGSAAASLVANRALSPVWQPALTGLMLGACSGLLFGLVDLLQQRRARAGRPAARDR